MATVIQLALNGSIMLLVFAIGLRASFGDAVYLLRRPKMYLLSIFSMNVVMTAFAVGVVLLLELPQATRIMLVALALSPVPPILSRKQMNAGGSAPYALGLMIATAASAIILVPAGLKVLDWYLGLGLHMPVQTVASIVLLTSIGPLLAGMAVRELAPAFAARVAGPLSTLALWLLLAAALPLLIVLWPQVQAMIGNGTLIVLALFAFVGLLVGHSLGGPTQEERTVLALATAARHPGMALAIAGLNFPDEKGVPAVVVWHLIIGAIIALAYTRSLRSRQSTPHG